MVIATQNPVEQAGTYKLPEAQLDRFLIKTSLGYPDYADLRRPADGFLEPRAGIEGHADHQVRLDLDDGRRSPLRSSSTRRSWSTSARSSTATRVDKDVTLGVSMRGAMALARAIKTWAISPGRTYVTPDDVRDLAVPVLAHRVIVDPESDFAGVTAEDIVERVLVDIAAARVPRRMIRTIDDDHDPRRPALPARLELRRG